MRRAALVHEHLDRRVLTHERPGDARVVEMDVGQEQLADVGDADSLAPERGSQGVERGRRPRVDERHPARALQDGGRDDLGISKKVEVDVVDP